MDRVGSAEMDADGSQATEKCLRIRRGGPVTTADGSESIIVNFAGRGPGDATATDRYAAH